MAGFSGFCSSALDFLVFAPLLLIFAGKVFLGFYLSVKRGEFAVRFLGVILRKIERMKNSVTLSAFLFFKNIDYLIMLNLFLTFYRP